MSYILKLIENKIKKLVNLGVGYKRNYVTFAFFFRKCVLSNVRRLCLYTGCVYSRVYTV